MKKLIIILTMIMLTSCKNSRSQDSFCLVYVKPQMSDGKLAELLYKADPEFVEDVNSNKLYYLENCK